MTLIYHGGTEVPGWRTLLQAEGVRHCALSFAGLTRRVKFARPWLLSTKFLPDTSILLDSGGYSIRKNAAKYSQEQILDLAGKYTTFTEQNLNRIEYVTEFDVPGTGTTSHALSEIAGKKYLPIWHADDGTAALRATADTYGRLAVTQTTARGRDILPELRRLARSGVQLHGLSITRPELIAAIPWTTVASTSWLAPAQYGTATIWTGLRLQTYNRAVAADSRRHNRHLIARAGFDTDLIEAGDATENLRLSAWSWLQYQSVVNTRTERTNMGFEEDDAETVDTDGAENGKRVVVTHRRAASEILPGFAVRQDEERYVNADGEFATRLVERIQTSAHSQRLCDTCFLAKSCDGFEAGATCLYNLPAHTDDKHHAQDLNIAIQQQRVAELYRYEQLEGGFGDPNVSREIKLLHEMLTDAIGRDIARVKTTSEAKSKAVATAGMLGRLFGEQASQQARAIEAHAPAANAIRDLGVVEAEVVYEGE